MWLYKKFPISGDQVWSDVEDFYSEVVEDFGEKYLTKSMEDHLHMKCHLYRFQMRHEIIIDEHINEFIKLLVHLLNLDEDKMLLLLNLHLN